MKVSVIIPVYNVENYLRQCIDSLVNQTLKDIEIILVDDGSTDSSLDICNEYTRKDERVKVFHQKNRGAAVARNLGIEKAKGEYLSILDSDDYFELNMLEKLYEKAEKDDLDCTICRCCIFDDRNKKILNADFSIKAEFLPNKDVFNYKDIPGHIFGFCVGWSWDKLYKRDFVIENKLKFQNLRSSNDLLFVFMSLVLAKRIGTIDDVLIMHRQNRPQQLSETREKDPICFIEAVEELKRQLIKKGLFDEVAQSYDNWVLGFCFWHLDTLKKTQAKRLKKKLAKYLFKKLEFFEKEKDYFYNPANYERLQTFKEEKMIHKIFSLKNKDNHKVLTILGVKFKFRRKKKFFENNDLTDFYGSEFYNFHAKKSYELAKEVLPLIYELFSSINSVLDIGAGVGTWLKPWLEYNSNIKILGLDVNNLCEGLFYVDRKYILQQDLKLFDAKSLGLSKFDIVQCLEVAEHLPKSDVDIFIKNITTLSDLILFSAAIPYQGGTNHLNEKDMQYWNEKFQKSGFHCFDILRAKIWNNEKIDWFYRQNMVLYAKNQAFEYLKQKGFSESDFVNTYYHPHLMKKIRGDVND